MTFFNKKFYLGLCCVFPFVLHSFPLMFSSFLQDLLHTAESQTEESENQPVFLQLLPKLEKRPSDKWNQDQRTSSRVQKSRKLNDRLDKNPIQYPLKYQTVFKTSSDIFLNIMACLLKLQIDHTQSRPLSLGQLGCHLKRSLQDEQNPLFSWSPCREWFSLTCNVVV